MVLANSLDQYQHRSTELPSWRHILDNRRSVGCSNRIVFILFLVGASLETITPERVLVRAMYDQIRLTGHVRMCASIELPKEVYLRAEAWFEAIAPGFC